MATQSPPGVRVGRAREVATAWVEAYRSDHPEVIGAFVSGSVLDRADEDALPATSDLDLVLVVRDWASAKLGKVTYAGVCLDVSVVGWDEVADPDVVARTHYLAPSFRGGGLLVDADGRLHGVQERVAPQFARPDVVWARCGGVLRRMQRGLAAVGAGGPWPSQVLGAVFPISLSTHVLLVAALRNPTVRLRYPAVRDLLFERGLEQVYPELLDQLGCRRVTRVEVRTHLAAMTAAFDDACRVDPVDLPFAGDIATGARAIAIDGTRSLTASGQHREAVFWLVVTFARSLLVLRARAAPEVVERHATAFAAATTDLIGAASRHDLTARAGKVREFLPRLDGLAREMLASAT